MLPPSLLQSGKREGVFQIVNAERSQNEYGTSGTPVIARRSTATRSSSSSDAAWKHKSLALGRCPTSDLRNSLPQFSPWTDHHANWDNLPQTPPAGAPVWVMVCLSTPSLPRHGPILGAGAIAAGAPSLTMRHVDWAPLPKTPQKTKFRRHRRRERQQEWDSAEALAHMERTM
ncbi:hypothetical protein B0H17DRAFT_1210766 [Mycena rosella]|uniref:Uncharacterized protein n=1 Tax=Mycena rosella TaxID=1033263 RepID=A0AAD7CVH3_MYCRO|nr:hypothetical protein B0H17DRAFT_1210766 [Mycena rosella]